MARRRRITSLALSTLAVTGGLATALPASASAAVVAPNQTPTETLTPTGINVLPGVNPTTGYAQFEIYLATSDTIGTNATYTVDWGDGTTSSTTGVPAPTWQTPLWMTHTYAAHQVYKGTVTVDEGNGAAPVSQIFSATRHYVQAPTEPSVILTTPGGDAPFTAEAEISGGTVDPAATKSYTVTWGDGSPAETVEAPASGPLKLQHLYAKMGRYLVTTHTTDGIDVSWSNYVENNTAWATGYGLTASATSVANGGAHLAQQGYGAPLANGHDYGYYVNWGDGSPVEQIASSYDQTHYYAKTGTYTISVKMADEADPNNTSLPQYTATTSVVIDSTETQTHPGGLGVGRFWGIDRYDTSAAVANQWAPGTADAVVLARGDTAPDALAGVPFAAHVNGPLLLTQTSAMPTVVRDMIDHVTGGPKTKKTVYILGGLSAVSQQQEDTLRTAGYTVVRIGGDTRYETALKVAAHFGATKHVIVATGLNFPDALAAGPLGAAENAPIVLTADAVTDPATAAFIRQHADVDPIGGQAQKAVAALNTAGQTVDHTLAGATRYATAVAVAARYAAVTGHTPTMVGLASGVVFPDALSGGAFAAKLGMPLLLTDPQALSPEAFRYVTDLRQAKALQFVEIFGGPNAVSPGIQKLLSAM
ncbi:putative cell wall-binding protein [Catenulispora sp. GP43]|uniref:cell wall-binding repeat-containing protein n=1 Tax=Catenulispora sp. GP43 TaxID=3156263 RepID=UPI003515E5FC